MTAQTLAERAADRIDWDGFCETEDGIHLINPLMGGEFTMCGDAFDAHTSEKMPGLKFKQPSRRIVTCPKCIEVILACRGKRIAQQALKRLEGE